MDKKIAHKLSKEARVSQPFLNKYYWEPDMDLVSCCADTDSGHDGNMPVV